MNRQQAYSAWRHGRVLGVGRASGTWKLKMWKRYRVLRLNRKIIKGAHGYNKFLFIKWGHFTVVSDGVRFVYKKHGIIDYLKLHPDDNILIGKFYQHGEFKAIFTLTKIGGDKE